MVIPSTIQFSVKSQGETDRMQTPFTVRRARVDDVPVIMHQRRAMFEAMHMGTPEQLDRMDREIGQWLAPRLASEEYLGWFVVDAEGSPQAGAGLWVIPWPPGPLDANQRRGYVLNVYTEPASRRYGLARLLLTTILDWCQAEGLITVSLHASIAGRPLYESLGFSQTNEMRKLLQDNH
jgi:GNAT superfamily N-acetyltransferase